MNIHEKVGAWSDLYVQIWDQLFFMWISRIFQLWPSLSNIILQYELEQSTGKLAEANRVSCAEIRVPLQPVVSVHRENQAATICSLVGPAWLFSTISLFFCRIMALTLLSTAHTHILPLLVPFSPLGLRQVTVHCCSLSGTSLPLCAIRQSHTACLIKDWQLKDRWHTQFLTPFFMSWCPMLYIF